MRLPPRERARAAHHRACRIRLATAHPSVCGLTPSDAKMLMMALLPPGGLLGGYGGDPDGVNGSWEEACTCVSTSIRVRVAVAAGEYPRHLPQRLFLACPRPASMACALPGRQTRILRPRWVARGFR